MLTLDGDDSVNKYDVEVDVLTGMEVKFVPSFQKHHWCDKHSPGNHPNDVELNSSLIICPTPIVGTVYWADNNWNDLLI